MIRWILRQLGLDYRSYPVPDTPARKALRGAVKTKLRRKLS